MIKKLSAIFFISLFVANLFILAIPQSASAASAKWIDRARIEYDGKLFTDVEPFDPEQEYVLSEDCTKIKGLEEADDSADLYELDSFGDCKKQTAITITNTGNFEIIAYRKSADEIIGIANGKAPAVDQVFQLFSRPPANERENDSTYYLTNGDGILKKELWVKTQSANIETCFLGDCKSGKLANNGNIVTEIPGYANINDIGSSSGGSSGAVEGCLSRPWTLSWFMCGIINGLADATDGIFDMVVRPLLRSGAINITDPNDKTFKIWSSFRIYGNIILVIALLVLVIGQSIGGGLIDSYTAKKMAPRLLGAAIMINLSIYIVAFLVDVTNVLGGGIDKLMESPLSSMSALNFTVNPGSAAIGIGATALVATGFLVLAGPLMSFLAVFVLLPALFAVIAVVVTLILRRGIIIFLVLISPVAFALFCLPNTEKYFKKWWDTLFKTLLVYPLVVMMFGVAKILSVTINPSSGSSGVPDFLGDLMSMIALIIPLFLIPFAFKMSGGIIGGVYGQLSGIGKKATQFIKGDARDENSLQSKVKRGLGERATQRQARLVGNRGDFSKSKLPRMRKLMSWGADRFGNVDARSARYIALARQRAEQLSQTGNDDLLYAGAGYVLKAGEAAKKGLWTKDANGDDIDLPEGDIDPDNDRYVDGKGRLISRSTFTRGKQLYGNTFEAVGNSLEYCTRKSLTDRDAGNMETAFGKNAYANDWDAGELGSVWATATYPHKAGLFSSLYYAKPYRDKNTGEVKFRDIGNDEHQYGVFVDYLHKGPLGYQLPARDQDYRTMLARQTALEDIVIGGGTLNDEEAKQLAQTYEVFDLASHSYTTGAGTGGPGGPPEETISATAGTAAAQPIIEQARQQRKDRGFSVEQVSAHERNINKEIRGADGKAFIDPHTGKALTTTVADAVVTGEMGKPEMPLVVPE